MKAKDVHRTILYRSYRSCSKESKARLLKALKVLSETGVGVIWQASALSYAFVWDETDNGWKFWYDLDVQLNLELRM